MVADVLSAAGVALGDLETQTRRLARRPFALRLLLEMAREGISLAGLRGLPALAERWLESTLASLPGSVRTQAGRLLDEVIDRMERDGLFSVAADGLGDAESTDALVRAGVLVLEVRREFWHLRPSHQVIADVRIAHRWCDADTLDTLHLGDRRRQSLHQARRLRLAVPLMIERPVGVGLIDSLIRSPDVRPLLKRGLLLGLAETDPLSNDVVGMVRTWLEEEDLSHAVLATVVRGQVVWMEALEDWLDEAWQRWPVERRDHLLDLLGAVSTRWGDGVAVLLGRWSQDDPAVLERAGYLFLHEPGEDTDALFTMRLEYLAGDIARIGPVRWPLLLQQHPYRAIKLLGVLLRRSRSGDAEEEGNTWWGHSFLDKDDLPLQALSLGTRAWAELGPWWCSLQPKQWFDISTASRGLQDNLLVRVVELLAGCLAQAMADDESFWQVVRSELPDPLREIDGWLLLRVGANLPAGARATAEVLSDWFTSDQCWARIRIGWHGNQWDLDLARDFVARVGRLLPDDSFRHLESWIAGYRERWTREDEERRRQRMRKTGALIRNHVGATSFRLLPELPADRLSCTTLTLLGELERKFSGSGSLQLGGSLSGGWITSVIPDEVADRWSPQEWVDHLNDLPQHAGPATWHQLDQRTAGVYDLGSLVSQLRSLSGRTPRRYLALAHRLDGSAPAAARAAIIAGIARRRPPERHQGPWEPLDDTAVAGVVLRADYLDEPECKREIAWVVIERPSFPWPDHLVASLEEMARGAVKPGVLASNEGHLDIYRMNEDACVALKALANQAQHHAGRRARVLAVATSLVDYPDAGRRAAAVDAAASCYESFPREAASVILAGTDDPLVAAQRDVVGPLLWLAANADPQTAETARARLTALAGDDREMVARTGGQVAVELCRQGILGPQDLDSYLAGKVPVRRGLARTTARYLSRHDPPDWMRDLALRLADDPDTETADTIIDALLSEPAGRLLGDRRFLGRLLATTACQRDLTGVIRACDRHDHLLPIATGILDIASQLVAEREETDRGVLRSEAFSLTGLLARLVEEAERERHFDIRVRALDAWDSLLESGVSAAARTFDTLVKGQL